ncbi:hypothetical protein FH972_015845 [Carpinus fangiana]|uniref:Uncharacterized protein n=1 Tax=Carpinus fangiana TaxID=176857 RepID=A0A5N6RHC5_9ROSI|nr:hypothetical protein FH972_015845 [Carpinus fangiana]
MAPRFQLRFTFTGPPLPKLASPLRLNMDFAAPSLKIRRVHTSGMHKLRLGTKAWVGRNEAARCWALARRQLAGEMEPRRDGLVAGETHVGSRW